MAKRVREFKRISLTAKTAEAIRKMIVDVTFDDHYRRVCILCDISFTPKKGYCHKCGGAGDRTRHPECEQGTSCIHVKSGSLQVARLIEAGIKVGKKRATLDIPCPYSSGDPNEAIITLLNASGRIILFAASEKKQLRLACERVAGEIKVYANRNAMEVLADAANG